MSEQVVSVFHTENGRAVQVIRSEARVMGEAAFFVKDPDGRIRGSYPDQEDAEEVAEVIVERLNGKL